MITKLQDFKFNKISVKFPLLGIILIAASSGLLAYVIYNHSKRDLELSIGKELIGIAHTGTLMIDSAAHEEIYMEDGQIVAQADFFTIKEILLKIKEANQLEKPLYTLRPAFDNPEMVEFVVMTDLINNKPYVGNQLKMTDYAAHVFKTGEAIATPLYQDEEGYWISSLAPIKDQEGEVVALLSVDREVDFFLHKLAMLRNKVLLLTGLAVTVCGILFFICTQPLIRRIKILAARTESLAQGELNNLIRVSSTDETGQLADSFNEMAKSLNQSQEKLKKYAHTLEEKVEERSIELKESQKEIEIMLDNLDQGILTFNLDGTLNPQHSAKAEAIFQETNFDEVDFQRLFEADMDTLITFNQWVDLIRNPKFFNSWDHYLKLNPFLEIKRSHADNDKIIKLDYRPIIENDKLQRIMLLATDVTEQRNSEKRLADTKKESQVEMDRILSLVRNDKNSLESFFEEVSEYMERFEKIKSEDDMMMEANALYRDLHTLKGNAGTFGFGELAEIASRIEEIYVVLRDQKDVA